jgi:hypothetical protein
MKYGRPTFRMLASLVSAWCGVGSNGENYDNDCSAGSIPTTTNCSSGNTNASGHCKTGSSVSNQGAATYCLTGGGGSSSNKTCSNGNQALGVTSCKTGTQACHCTTGSSA